MTHNADVTVVVTNYNYARFLPEAVASALTQEGGPPSVIVVDDGSTEAATDAVLAALPPPVEIVRQPNAGLSAARNAGLARASTPFLIVLDADDRLLPGALCALKAPLLAEGAPLGFSYGITRFFGDWEGILDMPPYDPFKLLYRHMIGSTALMRRELFEATGGFDPAIRGFEDWEFWLHALEHGWTGRRVDTETFLYRRHGSTMVSRARREYRHWYRLLRRKHAPLYARHAELAAETGASRSEQLVYRWFWGARPIPARVEQAIYALRWRASRGAGGSAT